MTRLRKSRKPVVAWMVSLENGRDWCSCVDRRAALAIAKDARKTDPTAKAVRVVEANPRAAAQLKLAKRVADRLVRFLDVESAGVDSFAAKLRMLSAVSAYRKGGKR